jgi:hypothetical protein
MEEKINENELTGLFKNVAEGDEADVLSVGSWLQIEFGSEILPNLLAFIDKFNFKETDRLANLIRLASQLQNPDEPTIPLDILRQLDSDNLWKRMGYGQAISKLGDIALKDLVSYIKNNATSKTGIIQAFLSLRYNLTNTGREINLIERKDSESIDYKHVDSDPVALGSEDFYVPGLWLKSAIGKLSEVSNYLLDYDVDIRRSAVALALALGKHASPLIMHALSESDILKAFQHLDGNILSPISNLPREGAPEAAGRAHFVLNRSLLFIMSKSEVVKKAISENKIEAHFVPTVDQDFIATLFFDRPNTPKSTDHPDDIIWTKDRYPQVCGIHGFIFELRTENDFSKWWAEKTALDEGEHFFLRFNAILALAMVGQPEFALDVLEGKITPPTSDLESLCKRAAFEAITFGVCEETPDRVIDVLLSFAKLDSAREVFGGDETVFPLYALAFIDDNPMVAQFLRTVVLDEDEQPLKRLQALFSYKAYRFRDWQDDFRDGYRFHELRMLHEPTASGIGLNEFNRVDRHARSIIIGSDFDLTNVSLTDLINLFYERRLWAGFVEYDVFFDSLYEVANTFSSQEYFNLLSGAFDRIPSEETRPDIAFETATEAIGLFFEHHMYGEAIKSAHIVINNRQCFWGASLKEEEDDLFNIYEYLAKSEAAQKRYRKALEPAKKAFRIRESIQGALLYGVLEGATNGEDAVREILGMLPETPDKTIKISEHLFQKQCFPIAYSARKLRSLDNIDSVGAFNKKLEAIVKFVAMVFLAASYQFSLPMTEDDKKRLCRPSFGDWKALAFSLAKRFSNEKATMHNSLIMDLAKVLNRGQSSGWLSSVINERNIGEHGGNQPPRELQNETIQGHLPKLQRFLKNLQLLEDGKLIFFDGLAETSDDGKGRYYSGLSLMGDHPDFASIQRIRISKEVRPFPSVCLLLEDNTPMPLDPFVIFDTCECKYKHLFMLNKVDMDKGTIVYHSLVCHEPLSGTSGEKGFMRLESMGFIPPRNEASGRSNSPNPPDKR